MQIEVANRHPSLSFDAARLKRAVGLVLRDAQVSEADVSIAVVSDPEMHALNRQYLAHDYPTDVLSFVLERDGARLEAELIVSADTAGREAERVGWSLDDELLFYVIHGALHLVGYDDVTPELSQTMRQEEERHLARFGLERRS